MKKNKTIIVNKEDVKNPLHPGLWESFLETLGIDPNATEVCLDLSPLDENQKILNAEDKVQRVKEFLKEKTKLFGNSEDDRGKGLMEALTNIGYIVNQ